MSDFSERERMHLMRMMLVAAQTVIIVNNVADVSVSTPMAVNVNNTAQSFEGWGTSLAWFGQYVGGLEGAKFLSSLASFSIMSAPILAASSCAFQAATRVLCRYHA